MQAQLFSLWSVACKHKADCDTGYNDKLSCTMLEKAAHQLSAIPLLRSSSIVASPLVALR